MKDQRGLTAQANVLATMSTSQMNLSAEEISTPPTQDRCPDTAVPSLRGQSVSNLA